jgi:antitoxin YefM
MNLITYTELRSNLKQVMHDVSDGHEPVTITRPNQEHMVLISLNDYKALEETAYLLGTEANARHLKKSLTSLKQGSLLKKDLLDE